MKWELKNWRIGELKNRTRRGFSSIPQFFNSSILLLALASCGFQPLHGQQYRASQAVDLSALRIEVSGSGTSLNTSGSLVPRRYDEQLKAAIADEVNLDGHRSEKRFRLAIVYEELEAAQFVNPDGTASRGDIIYNSTYSITRLADGKAIASGALQSISSYNSSQSADYASYVSIEDARRRGIIQLAESYKLRLATLLPALNDPHASEETVKPDAVPVPALQPVHKYEAIRPGY